MAEKIYEWAWLEESGEIFLSVKFNCTQTIMDCIDCFSEALSGFSGGPFKALVDVRLSENKIGYNEEMIVFYDRLLSFGINLGVMSFITSDKCYFLKAKVMNEFAKINKKPFFIKSFNDYDTAKKWLTGYEFLLDNSRPLFADIKDI